jgi:hypothetical protein
MHHPKPPVTTGVFDEANNGINNFLMSLRTIAQMVNPGLQNSFPVTRLPNVTTELSKVIQATEC